MTRTRLRAFLERISDAEFQYVETSIIDVLSKLENSQILIDLAHVLDLRSSKKEAADNIERYVLNAHYQNVGKRGVFENIVKRIRERGESEESNSNKLDERQRFSNHLAKLIFDLKMFLDNKDVSKSAQRLVEFLEEEYQEEISGKEFSELDYLNFLELNRRLSTGFLPSSTIPDRVSLLVEALEDEIDEQKKSAKSQKPNSKTTGDNI